MHVCNLNYFLSGIAAKWKNKFLSVYGHQIMEGDEKEKSIGDEKEKSIENKEIKNDAQP